MAADFVHEMRKAIDRKPTGATAPSVTVESKRDAIQTAIANQVSDYLINPVDMKQLVTRIREVHASSSRRRRLLTTSIR
jgi:response regulator RpfG family c-di-GMP phosphodiesterase